MLTLTLDGLPCDLPDNAAVALTLWAHDLRSGSTREATYSETFTLPPSARNRAALQVPHAPDSGSSAPYRKLPAVLQAGGVTLPVEVAVLEQTGPDGYDVTLYGPTADLFALVGERRLRELDLSAYDYVLNYEAVAAAQGNDCTKGYAYPLADDGRLTRRNPATSRLLWYELPEFVYFHVVLGQIVAECLPGYTLTGSLLAEDRWRRLGFWRGRPWPAIRQSVREGYALTLAAVPQATYADTHTNGAHYYRLALSPQPGAGTGANGAQQWQDNAFVVPAGLPCDVSITARLLFSGPASSQSNALARVTVQTAYAGEVSSPGGFYIANTEAVASKYIEFSGTYQRLLPGTELSLEVQLLGREVTLLPESTVVFTIGPRTYVGGPGHCDANLPDLAQSEFLQLAAGMFNAVFQADPVTRTFRADLFTDLERNRRADRVVDWSAKLDYGQGATTVFRLDGYAQANALAHAEPPAAYTGLYLPNPTGKGVLPVADAVLPASAELFTGPGFLVQPHLALAGGARVAWGPAVTAKVREGKTPSGSTQVADGQESTYLPYDPAHVYKLNDPPILYQGKFWFSAIDQSNLNPPPGTPGYSYQYFGQYPEEDILAPDNEEQVVIALVQNGPTRLANGLVVGFGEDAPGTRVFAATQYLSSAELDFATDLLPAYYPTLQALLQSCRVLTLPFTLSPADIAALDHLRPVRLDVRHWPGVGPVRGDFYVNKVMDYLPGVPGPVPVELLKLGDPVAGIHPAADPLPQRHKRAQWNEDGTVVAGEDERILLLEQ